jgi:hypothetical protein
MLDGFMGLLHGLGTIQPIAHDRLLLRFQWDRSKVPMTMPSLRSKAIAGSGLGNPRGSALRARDRTASALFLVLIRTKFAAFRLQRHGGHAARLGGGAQLLKGQGLHGVPPFVGFNR